MAFNVGELQATMEMDAAGLDPGLDEALSKLQGFVNTGQKTAKAGAKKIGDAMAPDTAATEKALAAIGKTLDQQTGAITKNTRAWAANEIGSDKLRDLEKLGVATKDYIDAITGVPGAQKRMQAALAGNADQLRELERITGQVQTAQIDFATQSRAVGEAASTAAAGVSEATTETRKFGDGLKGFSDGLDGVIEKLQEFGGSGKAAAAAAGAAIGAGLALAIAAAFEADTVTRKMRAVLGTTEQESAKYGKAAGTLFASNYGDSLDEVGEALVSVVKNMQGLGKVSEGVLVGITGQVISLAKTFDQDFNAVTRTAGQLMKTGLAKNATEALDIITKGLQSPVNAADDLLDTFDEYSTIFRSLGLTGKDALGLLSQGLKAGARDADTVADSLKEMLLRLQSGDSKQAIQSLGLNFDAAYQAIAKGGESAKTATDTIIDALNEVQDPAERSALAVGIFGTKAEDMQKAIAGLDVSSAADQFETAYGKIAGASANLDQIVGGSLQGAFEGVWRKMTQFASDGGSMLTPFLRTAAEAFGALVDVLSGALGFISDIPGPLWAIGAAVAIWATWGTIAAGATALAGGLLAMTVAARGFLAALGPIGILLAGVTIAMAYLSDTSDGVEDSIAAQAERFDSLAETLDKTTGAITANTRAAVLQQAQQTGVLDTLQAAGISLDLYADAALGNADAQKELAGEIAKAQAAAVGSTGAFKGMADVLDGAAVSQADLLSAIDSGDWGDVTAKVQEYANSVAAQSGNTSDATNIMDGFTSAMQAAGGPVLSLGGVMIQNGEAASQLATAQADAAQTAGDFGSSADAAYDKLLALATVSGLSASEIDAMGKAAGLTAPQIESIKTASDNATAAATPLAEALASGSSAASEMDAAIQQLQLALDTLAGNEITAEQATRAHEATIRAVAAAARDQADANATLTEAQAKVNDMTNAGTTSGAEYEAAQRALQEAQDGVKDSADKQSDSLDALADSAQGMTARSFEGAGGMANYDASVAAASATMTVQRQKFIESAVAAGVGQTAAEQLADAQGLIPANVKTAYDAIRAQEAKDAASGVASAANSVPGQKTTTFDANDRASAAIANIQRARDALNDKTITITTVAQSVGSGLPTGFGNTGGLSRTIAGFSDGGQVPGTPPSDPRADNVLASVMGTPIMLRSREFVEPEEAVNYYGLPFMEAVRRRTFPKLTGWADGGSPGGAAASYTPNVNVGAPVIQFTAVIDGKELAYQAEAVVDGRLVQVGDLLKQQRSAVRA